MDAPLRLEVRAVNDCRWSLALVSASGTEPVTVSEAKAHARIDHDEDDTEIGSLILAARQYVEEYTRRQLINATWAMYLDRFPREIVLPKPPYSSGLLITYYDYANQQQTLSAERYQVAEHDDPAKITAAYGHYWPATYPRYEAVTVLWTAGYGALKGDVPEPIRLAILKLVAHWYEHRGDEKADSPEVVDMLLAPYRTWWME